MKTTHALALTLTSVVLTVAIQEFRIASLRSKLSDSTSSNNPDSSNTSRPNAATADTGSLMADRTDTRRPRPNTKSKNGSDDETLIETTRKMWDSPVAKSMLNQSLKLAASMMYQDFIDGLNLTKEESDYFINLLTNEMAKQQEIGLKMMTASGEEREKMTEELEKAQNETEADIKTFLNNDEDFQSYQNYKDRYPERQQLDGIRAIMNEKKVNIDPQTEAKLVDAMYQARSATDPSGMQLQEETFSALENGNMAELFEKNWQNQQAILDKETAKFLNQEQLGAFQEYQKQYKEMQMSGIKMAEQMMKKKDE